MQWTEKTRSLPGQTKALIIKPQSRLSPSPLQKNFNCPPRISYPFRRYSLRLWVLRSLVATSDRYHARELHSPDQAARTSVSPAQLREPTQRSIETRGGSG